MKKLGCLRVFIFILLPCLICGFVIKPQDHRMTEWQVPVDLSSETGYLGWMPKIVADSEGRVHVFWAGWVSDYAPDSEYGNVIYYRVLEDGEFSSPVDVLAAKEKLILDAVQVTSEGELLVLWHEGVNLNISRANSSEAKQVSAWHTQLLVRENGLYLPDLLVDQERGGYYVTYSTLQAIYVLTYNEGMWSGPFLVATAQLGYVTNGRACVGENGDLNLTWVDHPVGRVNQGTAIEMLSWGRTGQTTRLQQQIYQAMESNGPTLDWPVLVCGQDEFLLAFWNNGVGSQTGRFYSISRDGGKSWQTNNVFSGQLSGQTAFAGLVQDAMGRVHVVTSAQGLDNFTGMRYAVWDEVEGWSDYQSLWPEISGEWPDMTLSSGNQLHLVWHQYGGKVYYTTRRIEAPYQKPVFRDTPELQKTESSLMGTMTLTPTPLHIINWQNERLFFDTSPSIPVSLAGIAALGFVGLCLGLYFGRRR